MHLIYKSAIQCLWNSSSPQCVHTLCNLLWGLFSIIPSSENRLAKPQNQKYILKYIFVLSRRCDRSFFFSRQKMPYHALLFLFQELCLKKQHQSTSICILCANLMDDWNAVSFQASHYVWMGQLSHRLILSSFQHTCDCLLSGNWGFQ